MILQHSMSGVRVGLVLEHSCNIILSIMMHCEYFIHELFFTLHIWNTGWSCNILMLLRELFLKPAAFGKEWCYRDALIPFSKSWKWPPPLSNKDGNAHLHCLKTYTYMYIYIYLIIYIRHLTHINSICNIVGCTGCRPPPP